MALGGMVTGEPLPGTSAATDVLSSSKFNEHSWFFKATQDITDKELFLWMVGFAIMVWFILMVWGGERVWKKDHKLRVLALLADGEGNLQV